MEADVATGCSALTTHRLLGAQKEKEALSSRTSGLL